MGQAFKIAFRYATYNFQRRLTRLNGIPAAIQIRFVQNFTTSMYSFPANRTVTGGSHEGMGQAFKIAFRYASCNFQRQLTRLNGIRAATQIRFDLKNRFPCNAPLQLGCTREWGRLSKPHSAALHAIFKGD